MPQRKITIDDYEVFSINVGESLEIAKEIFENQEYFFSSPTPTPKILDCGSHIGLATLYFKKLFPSARITCVEPIPENFNLLQKNVRANNLQSVNLINAAISNQPGNSIIFGEFDKSNPRFCGSSLFHDWANPGSSSLLTKTILLSSLLNEKIDFLKLDIEGLETGALKESESKINRVAEICIEFHGMNTNTENRLDEIIAILERNNFKVEVRHKIVQDVFPQKLLSWVEENGLSLATIRAKNLAFS
jgi:FkbM family methyltransferase